LISLPLLCPVMFWVFSACSQVMGSLPADGEIALLAALAWLTLWLSPKVTAWVLRLGVASYG
jgi:ABC-type transport system involved in cytochrome c biogenesis permease component